MRKEVLLAIVIGVGLGLLLTFGVWTANKALKAQKEDVSVSPTPNPVLNQTAPTPSGYFDLSILSPEEGDLFDTDTVMVTGTTMPSVNIIVTGEKEEQAVLSDATGKWEASVKLATGENDIKVVAFDAQSDNRVEKTLVVVYSTKFETP